MELKTIPETNGKYQISIDGKKIINVKTGHNLKQGVQKINGKQTGYYYVTLLLENGQYKAKRIAVHRLVLITWHGYPNDPDKIWVNHKDGNKANNHVDNLEWNTIQENINNAHQSGVIKKRTGKDHWNYGKKQPYSVRKKMSEKKKGAKHPKFKGYYVVRGFRFESANQVQKDWGIPAMTVIRRCKNPKFKDYYFLEKDKLNMD